MPLMRIRAFYLILALSALLSNVDAKSLIPGVLSDPALQPKFKERVPNGLSKDIKAVPEQGTTDTYKLELGVSSEHYTGLLNNGVKVKTKIFGYGQNGTYTWPGPTIEVKSTKAKGSPSIKVQYLNKLPNEHILPVDTNIHWAFCEEGYMDYTIQEVGVPSVTHLHGARSDFRYDGHPEAFYTPGNTVVGPFWNLVEGGFTDTSTYDNTDKAKTLWYHDHTLGLTRLNVYAGLAGFYLIRDNIDTGNDKNKLGIPAGEYEKLYVIQDRMFTVDGELFYPSSPNEPGYDGVITDEGAELPFENFPNGGPTILTEFFGDHMVVNGKIWPKADFKAREYRLHFLNGCDSRFLAIRFVAVDKTSTSATLGTPLRFTVIGGDQGLGNPRDFQFDPLVMEPGSRYDIVIDFAQAVGKRVIMQNLGGDAPFGGRLGDDLDPLEELFEARQTDRIMAFDISSNLKTVSKKLNAAAFPRWNGPPSQGITRQVALMEGRDQYGRLQPILGAPSSDPTIGLYAALTWIQPTTEIVGLGTTEDWYILNFSMDAHPVHLHLVNFEIIGDFTFTFTVDGEQETLQHMSDLKGSAPKITSISEFNEVIADRDSDPNFYKSGPKDMVVVLPGEDPENGFGRGTIIRATFDKVGKYVWHCHILSHEDHEMMRQYEVKELI